VIPVSATPAPPPGPAASTDAASSVPPSVRSAAAWSWRFLAIAGALVVVGYLVVVLKVIVVPVAIALMLTVLLTPVVRFCENKLHFSRALACATALLGLVIVVLGLVAAAGGSIASGFGDLKDQAQAGFDQFMDWLRTGPLNLDADDITKYVNTATKSLSSNTSTWVSGALGAAVTVGHVAACTLIALFCTFFFLQAGRTIWGWLVGRHPYGARDRVHQAGRRGIVSLSAYTRTQILVAFVDAVGIGLGALILGVPLARPLAILVFVGSFVPIVGAVVTGAVAVLVALVAKSWVVALIMLGVVLLVQQIEGHVLQPFLMGHAVSLHPVAVLLSVAAASFVGGIVGALFAVPLVAVLNTVTLYLHGHDKFPELGTDDHLTIRGRATSGDEPGRIPPMVADAERDLPGDGGEPA
jgi:predicted PurR-regulated permease PerM